MNVYIFLIVDPMSNWVEVIPTKANNMMAWWPF